MVPKRWTEPGALERAARRTPRAAAAAALIVGASAFALLRAQTLSPPRTVSIYAGTATAPAATVSISPASASVATGATVQFTATVSGTSNTSVAWSATGGTITSSGTYTAGPQTGGYSVTATLVGGSIAGTAPVSILGGLTNSVPLLISGQSGKVYSNLRITSTTGDCVQIINSTNITIQNSDIGPCGTNNSTVASRGIHISGGSGINVYDNYIHVETLASGCCDSHDGILIDNGSTSDVIQGNVVAYGESNVEIQGTNVNGVSIIGNYLLNPRGPFPRGQNVQVWGGSSSGFHSNITVQNNYTYSCTLAGAGVSCPAGGATYLYPENQEDSINFGHTNGFVVKGNYVVGGHSGSGCGLIADESANNGQFLTNIVSNTGQCGIGIADGATQTVDGNKVLNLTPVSGGGNTAIYVWKQYTPTCGPVTVSNNVADELKTDMTTHSGYWNGGGCDPVTLTSNTFDRAANLLLNPMSATNPPPLIPPAPKNCVAVSPYTSQISLPRCY